MLNYDFFHSKRWVLKFEPKKLYYWCSMNFCFCLLPATSSPLLHPFLQEEQMTAGFALWASALMADTLPVLQMTGNINMIYYIFFLFLLKICLFVCLFVFHCFCLVNDLKTKKARNKRMIFFMHQHDQFQQHISKWSIYNTLEHKTRMSHDKPTCVCLWASREYVCTVKRLCSLFMADM